MFIHTISIKYEEVKYLSVSFTLPPASDYKVEFASYLWKACVVTVYKLTNIQKWY